MVKFSLVSLGKIQLRDDVYHSDYGISLAYGGEFALHHNRPRAGTTKLDIDSFCVCGLSGCTDVDDKMLNQQERSSSA